MNTQPTGAQTRRTLSLHFGGKRTAEALDKKRPYSDLPSHELRRLVAAMVD
jgi:hypothetical protein